MFMSTIILCMAPPEATLAINYCSYFCTACERPAVIGTSTNPELSCHVCFNFSRLRSGSLTLHFDSQASTGLHMLHDIDLREIFECAHLISGRSKQTSKQANIHTDVCNAITLVWGSLRLVPIIEPTLLLKSKF